MNELIHWHFKTNIWSVFVFYCQVLTLAWSQICPRRCQCSAEPPMCPPGVPLLLDDCACCLVCARQGGQACSDMNPCDMRKGLRCEYSTDVRKRTGICVGERPSQNDGIKHWWTRTVISPLFPPPAHGGDACVLDGSVYQNGQTFFPSCKYQCMCRDGQIGCVPRCNLDVMLPGPDCPMPRRVQVPGECCEKWVCDPQAEASALGGFAMAGEWTETCLSRTHEVVAAIVAFAFVNVPKCNTRVVTWPVISVTAVWNVTIWDW